MQVDVNPMPASGAMTKAEMPPPDSHRCSEAGGRADSSRQAAGRRKGFHETMDDLLRADGAGKAEASGADASDRSDSQDREVSEKAPGKVSGEASGNAPAEDSDKQASEKVPEKREDSSAKHPEGTLLEIAAQQTERHQRAAPALTKTEGGAIPQQSEVLSKGAPTQEGGELEPTGDSAKAASPQAEQPHSGVPLKSTGAVTPLVADSIANAKSATNANNTAVAKQAAVADSAAEGDGDAAGTHGSSNAKTLSPSPVEAELRSQRGNPNGTSRPIEAEAASGAEATAGVRKGADSANTSTRARTDDRGRPASAEAGVHVKTGSVSADAVRPAPSQDGADPQPRPKAASTQAAMHTAGPEKGQPQTVATLVENLAKNGGEGKHLHTDVDTAMDPIGPSGTRGHTPSQSTTVNVVKADPTPSQAPPKEAVVQQIVDSAKLRLHNGQSEMRIQLKPEHLGKVRLNITTEHHQVVVKVVADQPMVKELLESNLHHLRTELQGQGLEIHKFHVSVGGESGSQSREQPTWGQQQSGRRGGGGSTQSESDHREQGFGSKHPRQQVAAGTADGVDYFA
jgi:hypothetical protein